MIKVLIVDDQAGWITFHKNAVYKVLGEDVTVDTASCAQEGYVKLLENSKKQYDFLLTDMQMESDYAPKMAGEWLIEQAKTIQSCYKTKIIIISASPSIKNIAEHYNVFYISKSNASVSVEPYKALLKPS